MAIFSNLEGTMNPSFMIGKRGGKLIYDNGTLKIMDSTETNYIPVRVATPTEDNHAVSLAYFNAHGGDGGLINLKGTADPTNDLGTNGQMYYKINTNNILGIYLKDSGIWKSIDYTPGTTPVTSTPMVSIGNSFMIVNPNSN